MFRIIQYMGLTLLFYSFLLSLSGCSSIHIQTGPQSTEDATKSSEQRGSSLKSQYAERLRNATPIMQMDIVRNLMESTTAMYFRYGDRISDEWSKGNYGRGEPVSVSEIRDLIFNSTRENQPVFDAYDEMIDYGFEQIELTGYFNGNIRGLLVDYRSIYESVVSLVLYPNGTLDEYQDRLINTKLEAEKLSDLLGQELEQVR